MMTEKTLAYFRNIVKEAIKSGKIAGFLGWREVTDMPGKTRAFVATTPEEADLLVFNSFSRENLSRLLGGKTFYVPELKKGQKFGVMVKGCDSRNLLANVAENKIDRDNLWVVGVKCPGTIDIDRVRSGLDSDIKSITDDGTILHIEMLDGKKTDLARSDYYDSRCLHCPYTEALEVDELLPDDMPKKPVKDWEKWMEAYLQKPFEDRRAYIISQLSRCTMCFACRDACPGCYCNANCIMDYPKLPEPYLQKGTSLASILTYHFIHYFHLSDRCTNCGECARACPEGIPLNLITEQIGYMTKTTWDFEPGISDKAKTPLALYKVEEVLGRWA